MIVSDLSNSFNPCPKPLKKAKKEPTQIKKKSAKLAKKEKKRTSILQKSKKCYICGSEKDLDIHECFGGKNRQKSMEYGLVIYLCRSHHSKVENNEDMKLQIKKYAQCIYNSKYEADSFIKEFGQSYL